MEECEKKKKPELRNRLHVQQENNRFTMERVHISLPIQLKPRKKNEHRTLKCSFRLLLLLLLLLRLLLLLLCIVACFSLSSLMNL